MIRSDRFSIPWAQLILKIVQIICLLLAIVMAGAWSSNETNFTDLTTGDTNQRPYFEFLIVVSAAGIVWAVASIIVLFPFKQGIPPVVVIAVNSVVALLVLIAACVFVSGIVSLDNSSLVQTKQLNIGVLEAASFFSIMAPFAYIGDIVLEIIATVFLVRALGFDKLYLPSCMDK